MYFKMECKTSWASPVIVSISEVDGASKDRYLTDLMIYGSFKYKKPGFGKFD